jgi:hypothetical protein
MSRLPNFLDNRLTDGGEVVRLSAGRSLASGIFLALISLRGCVDPRAIVRLKGLDQLKNPIPFSIAQPNSAKIKKTGRQQLVAPYVRKTLENKFLQWEVPIGK